jgi:hypothetical protein
MIFPTVLRVARPDSVLSVAQDDWRVTVTLPTEEHSGRVVASLAEAQVEKDVRETLGERVVVGGGDDPGVVFLYTGTPEAAHEAERVVQGIVAEHGLHAEYAIHRWHPEEERWEPEEAALPATEAQHEAEHEHLEDDEAEESEELGEALWEVRIEFDSHRDAVEMADRIESEADDLLAGYTVSVVRHWRYLLIGADNEDQAREIAEQVRGQLPSGAELKVEPSGALVWQAMKPSPFAVLGGLSG